MSTRQWVQHVSGQGEKFKVTGECNNIRDMWSVDIGNGFLTALPKSEYDSCDPPEEREDVTEQYLHLTGKRFYELAASDKFAYIDGLHHGPAFIIERKKKATDEAKPKA